MKIRSYQFGRIDIDGHVYRHDVKILDGQVVPEWWRRQSHFVDIEDVRDLLDTDADICIFGTGAYGSMQISESVQTELKRRGFQVIMEKTAAACNRFTHLHREGKRIIAGFHLTC